MSQLVAIEGSGVAACCCVRLLQSADLVTSTKRGQVSVGPVLMLSDQTQKLLADVFETDLLFENSIQIRRRIVLWGKDSEIKVLPHSGLVMSESALLDNLWGAVRMEDHFHRAGSPDWRLITGERPLTSEAHQFGSRIATASTVRLKSNVPQDACWMESLETGWLFLLPCGNGMGSLISVGGEPREVMAQSRLISDQISEIEDSGRKFPAYPRVSLPLCNPGWIACGTAAIGFDPICGEGAGNAVREAILGSAVIRGVTNGMNAQELLALYSSRLLNGFSRHLSLCLDFYKSACASNWWQTEISHLEKGLAWTEKQLSGREQQRYRLSGFALQQVG